MNTSALRAALGGLVLAAPVSLLAAGQVTGVKVTRLASGIEVFVTGDGLARPLARLSDGGRAYTLDFDAPLQGRPMQARTGFPAVPAVAVSRLAGANPRSRVVMTVASGTPRLASAGKGGWKVTVAPASAAPALTGSALPTSMRATRPLAAAPPRLVSARPVSARPSIAPVGFAIAPLPMDRPSPTTASKAPAPKPTTPKPTAPKAAAKIAKRTVSLEFVDTDVDQVFRALALQTGANIVTSGEVRKAQKSVSISLRGVDVDQAVNLLCTISGLRWAKTDGVYVVTTKDQFQETTRMAAGDTAAAMETRVVPLFSGQGSQVKTAVLKALGGDSAQGRFEIFLPSEKLVYDQKQDVTPEGRKKDGDTASLAVTSDATGGKDDYLVIVGSPSRLDEVQSLAKEIDGQICVATGRDRPNTAERFTRVYDVRGGRASDLLAAIVPKDAKKIGNVDVLATPPNSIARQTIVLNGREDEVARVYDSLKQLDSNDSSLRDFRILDLKFSDPRSMREMLVSNVPGLSVTIPPASVGNPRLFRPNDVRSQSEESGTQTPAPQGGGTPIATGLGQNGANQNQAQQQQITVGSDSLQMNGLQQPYKDYEPVAMPMRLVLRGSPEQIARGVELAASLDIAPKHVAIELRVMELNRNQALQAGIDFNLQNGGAVKFLRLNNSQPTSFNSGGLSLGSKSTPLDVTASLDRISNKNNLISRPNTIALDGRETELFVGDVIRYIKSIISTQNGVTVTTDEVRVGVRMALLPRIGGDGSITMDLRPAVSFLRGFDDVAQIGGKLPQTSERVAQSSFNMRSGETIAISGLITDQDRRLVQGLPFLMDLPIVGQLFRKTTNERVRSELVLFVTARTIEGPLGGDGQTLPAQPELPANQGFPGPEAPDAKSRTKAGAKESKESGPGKSAPPFSPSPAAPKNG